MASGACYLALALYLAAHDYLFLDTVSRVANASYVVFSRDPHLAAVGFVWNPLPSLAAIPLLLCKPLCPALSTLGFAGCVESVVSGAVAVVVVNRILHEFGVAARWVRLALVVLFAVHPAQLLLFADGATESIQLLALLVAALGVVRWVRAGGGSWNLTLAGIALACAYLTRYEGAPAAASLTLFVGLVSWGRASGPRRERWLVAMVDMALVAMPFLLAFGGWALASRFIVGHWFEQFSSEYGNSVQTQRAGLGGAGPGVMAWHLVRQVAMLAPAGAVLVLGCAVVAAVKNRWEFLAPLVTLLAPSLFDGLMATVGQTFSWLRFQMVWVAAAVLAAGGLAAVFETTRETRPRRHRALGALLIGIVALGPIASARAPWDGDLNPDGYAGIAAENSAGQWRTEREIARFIDGLQESTGDLVLLDASQEFQIEVAARHQDRFVIQSDRDFADILRDPKQHGVGYVLISSFEPPLDGPIVRRFPGLYENGGGVATLERSWRAGDRTWRLYRFH